MSSHEKIALITGSSKGIGFSIAKELVENNGVTAIICSRNINRALKASKNIKGKTLAVELDVTNEASIRDAINKILQYSDKIDILINNAGYEFDKNIWYKNFHDVGDEYIDKIIDVDLKGAIRLSKAVIPIMLKNKYKETKKGERERDNTELTNKKRSNFKEKGGIIINISSTPAIVGHIQGSPYTIAKAGSVALTKCIAREYGSKNIRAYTLALGNIATRATYDSMSKKDKRKAAMEPSMKRWGMPHEVAKVVACIVGDSFSFVTGNTIVIDGGTLML